MFLVFLEISLKFSFDACRLGSLAQQCSSHAFACKAVRNAAPRDSFHFLARAYVQGAPGARLLKPRHVFRRILAQLGLSFRTSRFRGSAAPWPAIPGQVAFAAEGLFISQKIKNGAAGYQHLERGANDVVSNICSPNSFSTERVLLISAESVCRT